ncbi:MAG: hypothetical protein J6K74_05700 [Marinifilaceae bacterium]|nr:hypothetical protein [Marinifilaceae bacterium]
MSQQIKSLFLLAAMAAGIFGYRWLAELSFLSPYLISSMLLFTYCKVSLKDLHFTPLHWWLLGFQLLVSLLCYVVLSPINAILAQGVMICIFIPTANASPVIAGMLGGNVAVLATYLLLCNVCAALMAPIYFSFMGESAEYSFWGTVLYICKRVIPLIIGPLLVAQIIERVSKRVHDKMKKLQKVTFYLWNITLMFVMAGATKFIIKELESGVLRVGEFILYLAAALVVCLLQFWLGRRIGHKYGDAVVGGQGLGQKNTILAIWMTQTYLNPVACIVPTAYIVWQNIVNSVQIWQHKSDK